MPYAAIRYKIKLGHEDQVAGIFANFRRVSSPILGNEHGEEVGKLLGTAVFLDEGTVLRVIHYEGDFTRISHHMAGQEGVRRAEQQLVPHLTEPRDTTTEEGFVRHFARSTMRCISHVPPIAPGGQPPANPGAPS